MRKSLALLIILLAACPAWAQDVSTETATLPYYRYVYHSQRYFSILTGYNFGKDDYAELGLALNTRRRKRGNMSGTAWYIADELKMRNSFLMGPKAGVWVGNGLLAGMSMIYYTDLDKASCLRLRPEIGVGEHNWKLTYGYNIPLNHSEFAGVSKHVVNLSILWKAAKLDEHTVAKDWDPAGRKKYASRNHRDSTHSTDYTVLVAGLHGWRNAFGEVGIGMYSEETEKRKYKYTVSGYLSAEFRLGKETIIGPKVGMYMSHGKKFGIAYGASIVYFTGMHNGSLIARPELGVHYSTFRLTYGYNHVFTKYSYDAIAQHNISAVMGVKFGRGKTSTKVKTEDRSF